MESRNLKVLFLTIIFVFSIYYFSFCWEKIIGGPNNDVGHSVQLTSDGGFIITGWTDSFTGSWGNSDIYLVKTDGCGGIEWQKSFGGPYWENGWAVTQTAEGDYVVGGFIASASTMQDVALIKTDASGNTLWMKTYGGTEDDYGFRFEVRPCLQT